MQAKMKAIILALSLMKEAENILKAESNARNGNQ